MEGGVGRWLEEVKGKGVEGVLEVGKLGGGGKSKLKAGEGERARWREGGRAGLSQA